MLIIQLSRVDALVVNELEARRDTDHCGTQKISLPKADARTGFRTSARRDGGHFLSGEGLDSVVPKGQGIVNK